MISLKPKTYLNINVNTFQSTYNKFSYTYIFEQTKCEKSISLIRFYWFYIIL